jgi:cytidyltransferase-like protein
VQETKSELSDLGVGKMTERKPVWVYVDVVCDLFHAGHVEFFKQARALGDRLIVGVVSDQDASTYKPAPIMSYAERLAVVRACRYVDRVLDEPSPLHCTCVFLDSIGADFACHGDDFDPNEVARWYADLIPAARIKMVTYTRGISSREIIERVTARLRERSLRSSL